MTVHDALDHPWLREDHDYNSRIPSSRFDGLRQRIRGRYVSPIDCERNTRVVFLAWLR